MNRRTLFAFIGVAAVSVAAFWFIPRWNKNPQQPPMSELEKRLIVKELENKILQQQRILFLAERDSLTKLSRQVNNYYHYTYDNAMQQAPDACKPIIQVLHTAAELRDSMRVVEINHRDLIIQEDTKALDNYREIITLKDYKLKITQDTLNTVRGELKDQKKKTNRAKIFGWVKTASAIVLTIFITSKTN